MICQSYGLGAPTRKVFFIQHVGATVHASSIGKWSVFRFHRSEIRF